jgi:Flp pilus assembly protein TadG
MKLSTPVIASIVRSRAQRLRNDTAGAVAAELAIISPFLLLLVVGAIDFGNYMNGSQALAAATRVGAEYAIAGKKCVTNTTSNSGIDKTTGTIGSDCVTGITDAMTSAFSYGGAFIAGTPTMACFCEDGSSVACTLAATCSATTLPKSVFITVTARDAVNPIAPWPKLPGTITLAGLTKLRIQ